MNVNDFSLSSCTSSPKCLPDVCDIGKAITALLTRLFLLSASQPRNLCYVVLRRSAIILTVRVTQREVITARPKSAVQTNQWAESLDPKGGWKRKRTSTNNLTGFTSIRGTLYAAGCGVNVLAVAATTVATTSGTTDNMLIIALIIQVHIDLLERISANASRFAYKEQWHSVPLVTGLL